jgi:two-component system, response regulator PdtaR
MSLPPGARKIITGGQTQIERLKGTLVERIRDLLSGRYDAGYVARRWRVGWRHVEIGLEQVYTNAALSRLRNGLISGLYEGWSGDPLTVKETVQALNKLIDLDLAIIDIKMPDMDGIDAATQLYRNGPVPVILVLAFHDPEFIRRAEADHILAYLVKPIKQADLEPAIGIALRRFEQFQALRKETSDLKQALEGRKVIEKAKGILMKKAGLDEHDAFRRLQKLASDKNRKLIEIAQMILTAEEALEPPSRG